MRRYELSVVSYLDILGFRKVIESKSADEIYEILSSFKAVTGPNPATGYTEVGDVDALGREIEPLKYTFDIFSDLAVRSIPVADESLGWLLGFESHCLQYIQKSVLHLGMIVRGAVTVGEINSDNRLVFGPALVRAYELEKRIACFPRILFRSGYRRAVSARNARTAR
jgi:hypothetical protein